MRPTAHGPKPPKPRGAASTEARLSDERGRSLFDCLEKKKISVFRRDREAPPSAAWLAPVSPWSAGRGPPLCPASTEHRRLEQQNKTPFLPPLFPLQSMASHGPQIISRVLVLFPLVWAEISWDFMALNNLCPVMFKASSLILGLC